MKFDMLCNIVLEGKKSEQPIKVGISNDTPIFSIDDVLRDPADPSKGVKTYLDERIKGLDSEAPVDPEAQARRMLRRLNWVTKTIIRRTGTREINIRKLHQSIMSILEQYMKVVLRYDEDEINNSKYKIAKEAAFIGNLLLAPTERNPKAKGVFVAIEGGPGQEVKRNKPGKDGLTVSERIAKEFNMSVDEFVSALDPDLLGTIKTIIKDGAIKKSKETVTSTPEIETPETSEENVQTESTEPGEGVTINDIMNDPRIKGVYDPRIVRKVIKSMLDIGSVIQNADGFLVLPKPGEADWRQKYDKYREEKDVEKLGPEDLPEKEDIESLPDDPVIPDVKAEDEEEQDIEDEEEIAARRLGYKNYSREEEEDKEEDEPDSDNNWYR